MSRLSAQDWLLAAVEQTARAGAHSVRVEPLAKALGVSKGSFYWHFKDRAALLAGMLEYWEREGTLSIIQEVDAKAKCPKKRLHILVGRVFTSTSTELAFETALRAWAASDPKIHAVVQRVDQRRVSYVEDLLQQSGHSKAQARARADLFYSALTGDMLRSTYGKTSISATQLKLLRQFLGAQT